MVEFARLPCDTPCLVESSQESNGGEIASGFCSMRQGGERIRRESFLRQNKPDTSYASWERIQAKEHVVQKSCKEGYSRSVWPDYDCRTATQLSRIALLKLYHDNLLPSKSTKKIYQLVVLLPLTPARVSENARK